MLGKRKIVAVVQARYDSKRLYGKALAEINGMPALEWVVRAANAVPQIDEVVVATSDHGSDDIIADWCIRKNIMLFRGSKTDVLNRFYHAAKDRDANIVVRLTGDCPFLDPAVCSQLLLAFDQNQVDYATNSHPGTWPDGLDCEVMKISALQSAYEEAKLPSEREHVTRWIRANKHRFSQTVLICPLKRMHEERWTLDNSQDLQFLKSVAEKLTPSRPPHFHEILHVLNTYPSLREKIVKGSRNEKLIQSLAADFNAIGNSSRAFSQSSLALKSATNVIPTGSQTFSKSKLILPVNKGPLFLSHGLGARVWDVDGNEYVDLVSALLPVILGYCDPDVDYAIRDQLPFGIVHSLSTVLETELAALIIKHVPSAEMVRFGKNGTDATSAAVRISRAFTKRDHVAVGGYHGWQDWYVGSTNRNKGIPSSVSELTHRFDPEDPSSLRALLEARPHDYAAIILEPLSSFPQTTERLQEIRNLSHEFGVVLIFDEICTGFRVDMGGAQKLFGVTPDLTCMGKAIANGMPLAAIAGRSDVMAEFDHVFVSGTFSGEALSLAAAITTIKKLDRHSVPEVIGKKGRRLRDGVTQLVKANNLSDYIVISGHASWQFVNLAEHPHGSATEIRTFMMRQLFEAGVLAIASHNMSYAFSDANEAIVLMAYEKALSELSSALYKGPLIDCIDCEIIRPIFSVRK